MAGKKPWTLLWLKAVRDQPDRPPPVQRHVLTCLLLRVDWESGEGFASTESLMADADCGASTVKRATGWARGHRLLAIKKRGHRRGDGVLVATSWVLSLPASTGHGRPVEAASTGHGRPVEEVSRGQSRRLNGSIAASVGVSTAHLSRPVTTRPKPSAREAVLVGSIVPAAASGGPDGEISSQGKTPGGGQCAECGRSAEDGVRFHSPDLCHDCWASP